MGVLKIKFRFIVISLFIVLFLLSGCENVDLRDISDEDLERISDKAVVCNKPYIRIGMECCLDQNDNKICDRDERELTPEEKEKEEKSVETTQIQTKQTSGKLIQIPFKEGYASAPDIWEDKIAFVGVNKNYDGAIYLYDIPTNEIKRITYDNSGKGRPFIYNNLIFWKDDRFMDNRYVPDVFMYDLSSEKEIRLLEGLTLFDNYEDTLYVLDGMKVKWYLYYLNEDKFKELPIEFKDMDYYSMYGDKMVFTKLDFLTQTFNIFYYDVLTNKIIQITNNTLDEKDPYIYKNKIVWSDNRNGKRNYDIYLYDLDTKKETQITSQQDTVEFKPAMYEDYIVYIKTVNSKNYIHLYNIKTKEDKKISKQVWTSKLKMYDNKIVWSDCEDEWCRTEDTRIYLYII